MTNSSSETSFSFNDGVKRIVPLSDGDRLFTMDNDRTFRMLSVHTRALVKHIESSSHEIHDIALISGEHVLVICTNSTLCKWNISNCCLLAMVEFRRSPESSTNVGHRRLLAYGPLNCIWEYQWDTANPVTHTHRLESSYIHNSQIAAWGNRFVVLPNNQAPIQIWNLLTMRHIGKVNICDEHINCVSLNDCFLATGSREHSIRVYSMHTVACTLYAASRRTGLRSQESS